MIIKFGYILFHGLDLKTIGGVFACLGLKTKHGEFGGSRLKTVIVGFYRFGPKKLEHEGLIDMWWNFKACIKVKAELRRRRVHRIAEEKLRQLYPCGLFG